MSNYRRSRTKGGVFFFTVVTHNRLPIFKYVENIRMLRSISDEVRNELPFKEIACVILHDHIHCIWKLPNGDHDFSKRWGIIKARFSKNLRSRAVNISDQKIWQKRFWEHEISDISDLNNHLDYLHYNPVKHGYVNRVCDWQYSSFHRFVGCGYYDTDWGRNINLSHPDQFGE